jgi:ketosteroid isomerase-like protein
MRIGSFVGVLCAAILTTARADDLAERAQQVRAAETAFARSMADRDVAAFAALVAEDAVFFGRDKATHGKDAVVASWKPLFDGKDAPFSWESAQVEVLDSGGLAHSSGPVYDREGKRVGTFNSIWRREADGSWKVVFDKGCDVCECAAASKSEGS